MADTATYKFHIYFFGLICHIGDGAFKHFAAIVRDKDHNPVVRYNDGNFGIDAPIDADTESLKFEIGGKITESDANATSDFLRFVPSLQNLMGGSPRINIKEYAIPVYYPETASTSPDLDVVRLYQDAAWYHRFGTSLRAVGCVARLTGIVVDVPSNDCKLRVAQIKGDGKVVYIGPFDPNSCIVIGNLPKDPRMIQGHVMKYGKILIENESLVNVLRPYDCQVKWKKNAACEWVREWLEGPAATDVECGNTQWP